MTAPAMRIWIDLDNSPHVPFFRPIIEELRKRGCSVVLTARDAYQVSELLKLYNVNCETIGRHFGRNKLMKALGLLVRSVQLLPRVISDRPHIAVSHGSRSQAMTAKWLVIPSLVIADYEHVTHVTRPDWMMVPDVIPAATARKYAGQVFQYPGIKEDVYVARFRPEAGLRARLGVEEGEILATLRPPATEAHYHNPEAEVLLEEVVGVLSRRPDARMVLLPRNQRQKAELMQRWEGLVGSGKLIVPGEAIDGLNLLWHSDFVVSGGGTMNREAAALGIPVYSIFRGELGAVDRYLAENGRLVLLGSPADVRNLMKIEKRADGQAAQAMDRPALGAIVDRIVALASGRAA